MDYVANNCVIFMQSTATAWRPHHSSTYNVIDFPYLLRCSAWLWIHPFCGIYTPYYQRLTLPSYCVFQLPTSISSVVITTSQKSKLGDTICLSRSLPAYRKVMELDVPIYSIEGNVSNNGFPFFYVCLTHCFLKSTIKTVTSIRCFTPFPMLVAHHE